MCTLGSKDVRPADRRWSLGAPARVARTVLQRTVLFPVVSVLTPTTILGRERLGSVSGPVVVVANHISHLDTPVILKALPGRLRRRLVVAAAKDYFYKSRIRGALVSLSLATVPFDRLGDSAGSLAACEELVGRGWSILLFPEGTRSATGKLGRVRSGAAVVACRTGIPVLPVFVHGLADVMPKGAVAPMPGGVVVVVGEPIPPGASVDETRDLIEAELLSLAESAPEWGRAMEGD